MKDPKLTYFDAEEKELIESIENNFDDWKPITDPVLLKSLQTAADNTLKKIRKTSLLNMRVNPEDVSVIKEKAQKIGIPYQTYISMILRQVAQGKINVRI